MVNRGKIWTLFASAALAKIAVFSLISTLDGQMLQKLFPTAHPALPTDGPSACPPTRNSALTSNAEPVRTRFKRRTLPVERSG